MTDDCCDPPHPLVRDGTSQRQRLPEMLSPQAIQLDDRTLEDLLIWALGYAEQLVYYDRSNEADGDWTPFVDGDIATLIATISKADIGPVKDRFAAARAEAERRGDESDDLERIENRIDRFRALCTELIRLAAQFEDWRKASVSGLELRRRLDAAIQSELSPAVGRLKSYDLGAAAEEALKAPLDLDYSALGASWNLDDIEPDSSIYDGKTVDLKIDYAIGRIAALFDQMHNALVRLIGGTGEMMAEALRKYPQHSPHFALFLTFLELFRYAQSELNGLTGRHLDFYYRDVLRLAPRPAQPDHAHLIAELAKHIKKAYPLRQDTLFKDGKDATGVELRYALDDDVTLNRASIVDLRALYIDRDTRPTTFHVSEQAASSDGQGGEFGESEEPRWKTFGQDAARPVADLGLAVASPMFYLEGGARRIGVTLRLRGGYSAGKEPEAKQLFTAYLTTAEGWFQVDIEPGKNGGAQGVHDGGAALPPTEKPPYKPDDGKVSNPVGDLTVDAIQGIGPVYRSRLEASGIRNVADLSVFDPDASGASIPRLSLWEFRIKAELVMSFDPAALGASKLLDWPLPTLLTTDVPTLANEARLSAAWAETFQLELRRIQAVVDEPVVAALTLKDFVRPEAAPQVAPFLPRRPSDLGVSKLVGATTLGVKSDPTMPRLPIRIPPSLVGTLRRSGDSAITLEIELGPEAPPIVAYQEELHGDGFATKLPVLKLVADQVQARDDYDKLSSADLVGIETAVAVTGLRHMVLESDFGPLAPDKPFLPFSPAPKSGSAFLIGSWEALQKSVSDLWLTVQWLDAPEDFEEHYKQYGQTGPHRVSSNGYFNCTTAVLVGRDWQPLEAAPRLFADEDVSADYDITVIQRKSETSSASDLKPDSILPLKRAPNLKRFDGFTRDLSRGFVRLQLVEDFRHGVFGGVYAEKAILKATSAPDTILPNTPYTPAMQGISLNYTTAVENVPLPVAAQQDEPPLVEQLFHLHPFGHDEITAAKPKLLPRFELVERQADGSRPQKAIVGMLLMGIKDLAPPQNLSVLFQVAEGSADPSVSAPPVVTWSYLKGNQWIEFEQNEILREPTGGLLRSGIVEFSVPSGADKTHTILPADFFWLRAAVTATPEGVCDMVAIRAQALPVTFADQGNDPAHYDAPLAAGSIATLVERDAAIAKLEQPFASFGARPAEQGEDYYRRISERLRHKDRAITIWDYERLVLENFPTVYKVKCLSHTDYTLKLPGGDETGSELVPGAVTIVTVANLHNQNAVDKLAPRASQATLQSIKEFLAERMSPVVAERLYVINPDYERIKTEFKVTFRQGWDIGFYKSKLRDGIIEFLSPWAFSEGVDIAFGGRIHSSTIVNFIDEQEYVDAVLDFQMSLGDVPVSEAVAESARSILVSAEDHSIEVLE